MFTHPGAKLLFMGNEFGQTSEWNYQTELDWHLLDFEGHRGLREAVRGLNRLYRTRKALHQLQFEPGGFEWVDLNHRAASVISYLRKGRGEGDLVLIVLNLTPVPRHDWKVRVRGRTRWEEVFNSDSRDFGGAGDVYNPDIPVEVLDAEEAYVELTLHLPPLGGLVLA
jgi:1,4-alpha-glucan branching enzyme